MLRSESENFITPQAADLLISFRDPDMALLYLYLCRNGETADREAARRALLLPKHRLEEAWERLEVCGLLPGSGAAAAAETVSPAKPAPAVPSVEDASQQPGVSGTGATESAPAEAEPPQYTGEEVSAQVHTDPGFAAVVSEARLIIGRHLSSAELVKLYGIYDFYEMPAEVLMELMHFVADVYREKFGSAKRPTAGAFEREAKEWRAKGIADFDAAEQYIHRWRERRTLDDAIKEAMGIRNREFSPTERRLVDGWLDWGFGPEEIALAYDRTVTNARKFSPNYMNSILSSWHGKGLHRTAEILEKDRPASAPRNGRKPSAATTGKSVPDPEDIWDVVSRI